MRIGEWRDVGRMYCMLGNKESERPSGYQLYSGIILIDCRHHRNLKVSGCPAFDYQPPLDPFTFIGDMLHVSMSSQSFYLLGDFFVFVPFLCPFPFSHIHPYAIAFADFFLTGMRS